MPFVIRFYDEVDILIGGILAIISFIGFLLTNRRSVIASPILQAKTQFLILLSFHSVFIQAKKNRFLNVFLFF